VRDVRQAVTGSLAPSFRAELAAAEAALDAAGIEVKIDVDPAQLEAAHETTIAWALREAITNVVKHSGARTCRITVRAVAGATTLDVEDDGCGSGEAIFGTGLNGLADRVQALGGTLRVERHEQQGFRLWVQLSSLAPTSPNGVHAG
jgi:two-component system, NarL family, sensor histidine kinase DesK